MRHLLVALCLVAALPPWYSEAHFPEFDCGTRDPSPHELLHMDSVTNHRNITWRHVQETDGPFVVPVFIHNFVTQDAQAERLVGVMTDTQAIDMMAFLNSRFAPDFSFELISLERIFTPEYYICREELEQEWKPPYHVAGTNALNVWTCNCTSGGKAGWATYPPEANHPDDGIVILSPDLYYATGTYLTAVHEVGHWLSLLHTYYGGCSPDEQRVEGYVVSDGDGVDDTPAHASPSLQTDPVGAEVCWVGVPTPDSCVDVAGIDPGLDPITNWMNVIPFNCFEQFGMFTSMQRQRMLQQYRMFRLSAPFQCQTLGNPCNVTGECCSGRCLVNLNSGIKQCMDVPTCIPQGQGVCLANTDCCENLICYGEDGVCETPGRNCVGENAPCDRADDCCIGLSCGLSGGQNVCLLLVDTEQPESTPPSLRPVADPTGVPSLRPAPKPTAMPSLKPVENSTAAPSMVPVADSTVVPSKQPVSDPTVAPTELRIESPTLRPSMSPMKIATDSPQENSTWVPSAVPVSDHTFLPSRQLGPAPKQTAMPSLRPMENSTAAPSTVPGANYTVVPSKQPIFDPTVAPSKLRVDLPTLRPSMSPTNFPPVSSTLGPSAAPVSDPTSLPSRQPQADPSGVPTLRPVEDPSVQPFEVPFESPSVAPFESPVVSPTFLPTPVVSPTFLPTTVSDAPSSTPSNIPSQQPVQTVSKPTKTQVTRTPTHSCVQEGQECRNSVECCNDNLCANQNGSFVCQNTCLSENRLCMLSSQCCDGYVCDKVDGLDRCIPGSCLTEGLSCNTDDECCDSQLCVKTYAGSVCHAPCCDSTFCMASGLPRCDGGCGFRDQPCDIDDDCCADLECSRMVVGGVANQVCRVGR